MGWPIAPIFTVIFGLPVLIIKLILARKDSERIKLLLAKSCVYAIMCLLIIAGLTLDDRVAHKRAAVIIAACEAYKAKNGTYPQKLDNLVPEFLPYIPPSKYTPLMSRFYYSTGNNSPTLMYVKIPPFGRPYYIFETKTWGMLD